MGCQASDTLARRQRRCHKSLSLAQNACSARFYNSFFSHPERTKSVRLLGLWQNSERFTFRIMQECFKDVLGKGGCFLHVNATIWRLGKSDNNPVRRFGKRKGLGRKKRFSKRTVGKMDCLRLNAGIQGQSILDKGSTCGKMLSCLGKTNPGASCRILAVQTTPYPRWILQKV